MVKWKSEIHSANSALLYSSSKVASGKPFQTSINKPPKSAQEGRLRVQDLKIITMADAQVSFMLVMLSITASHRSA